MRIEGPRHRVGTPRGYSYVYYVLLAYEEQLAVFGERPHLVVDEKLEFVDVIADNLEAGSDVE